MPAVLPAIAMPAPMLTSLQILLPDRIDREFRRWAKRTPGSSWPSWGGHVTLLPRVAIAHLDQATLRQRIEAVCARYEPFQIYIDEILHDADYTRPGYEGVFLRMRTSSNEAATAEVRDVDKLVYLNGEINPEDETLELPAVELEAVEPEYIEPEPVEVLTLDLSASDLSEIGSVAVYDAPAPEAEPPRELVDEEAAAREWPQERPQERPQEQAEEISGAGGAALGYHRLNQLRNDLLAALAEGAEPDSETAEALRAAQRREFRPHLTLALSLSELEAQEIVEAARAAGLEARFTVRRVWLLLFDRAATTAQNTQRIEFSLGKERTLSMRNLSRAVDLRRDKSPAAPAAPAQPGQRELSEANAAEATTEGTTP